MTSTQELNKPSGLVPSAAAAAINPPTENAGQPTKSKKSILMSLSKRKKASLKKLKSIIPEKKRAHKQPVKYSCTHCNFETTNIMKHFTHKKQHKEDEKQNISKVFRCHNCEYSSKVKGGLQRHIKIVHTKERPFTCPVCNYRTIDKPSMAKHIIKKHEEDFGADIAMYVDCMKAGGGVGNAEKGALCDADSIGEKEGALIKDGDDANRHCDKANYAILEYNFACTDNDSNDTKKIPELRNNDSKLKRTHQKSQSEDVINTDNVECPKDNVATTADKQNLSKPAAKNYFRTPEYRELRNRKLTCEYCKILCGSQRELQVHTNSHKECNIHCPICHKFIVDQDERVRHIDNHLKLNSFVCATCLSSFENESQVMAHQQREHRKSLKLIMECMFCPFSSRSQERFSRHMTRCHMLSSEIPKHNPFDVAKMKKLLMETQCLPTSLQPDSAAYHMSIPMQVSGDNAVSQTINEINYLNSQLSQEQQSTTENLVDFNGNDKDESLLDCSLLDMSGEFDETIDDLEELLDDKSNQFQGFNTNSDNITNPYVKIQNIFPNYETGLPPSNSGNSIPYQPIEPVPVNDFHQCKFPQAQNGSNSISCINPFNAQTFSHSNSTKFNSTGNQVTNHSYDPNGMKNQGAIGYDDKICHNVNNPSVSITFNNASKDTNHIERYTNMLPRNVCINGNPDFRTFPSPDSTS